MADRWIIIPGWDKFQHYGVRRRPLWIKLYTELRDKDEWCGLTLAQQGLLVNLWILYAHSDGLVKASTVPALIPQKTRRSSIEALIQAGFIQVSASKPLALRYQAASPEGEGEEETPKPPYRERTKPSSNGTACPHCGVTKQGPRSLAEHIENVHYDLTTQTEAAP